MSNFDETWDWDDVPQTQTADDIKHGDTVETKDNVSGDSEVQAAARAAEKSANDDKGFGEWLQSESGGGETVLPIKTNEDADKTKKQGDSTTATGSEKVGSGDGDKDKSGGKDAETTGDLSDEEKAAAAEKEAGGQKPADKDAAAADKAKEKDKGAADDDADGEGKKAKDDVAGESADVEKVIEAAVAASYKGFYEDLAPIFGLPDLKEGDKVDSFTLLSTIQEKNEAQNEEQVQNLLGDWKSKLQEGDPFLAAALKFSAQGGHSDQFLEMWSLANYGGDLSQEDVQIQLVSDELRRSNYTSDEITEAVQVLKDGGTLEKRAKALDSNGREASKVKLKELADASIVLFQKRKEAKESLVTSVKKRLSEDEPIYGLTMGAREKSKLYNFIFSGTEKVGDRLLTPFSTKISPEMGGSIEDFLYMARGLMTGWNMDHLKAENKGADKDRVRTEITREIRNRLGTTVPGDSITRKAVEEETAGSNVWDRFA